jgi:hypothetical protein
MHASGTQQNTPGAVPAIRRVAPTLIPPDECPTMDKRRLLVRIRTTPSPTIILPHVPVPGGMRASPQLVSQQALIAMMMREALQPLVTFMPGHFVQKNVQGDTPLCTFCITHGASNYG